MERAIIRNYAAQAERALRQMADVIGARARDKMSAVDAATVSDAADKISRAVHFALPEGGVIMDDDLRGIRGEFVKLPFPLVTIEFFVPPAPDDNADTPVYAPKRLVIAEEKPKASIATVFVKDGQAVPTLLRGDGNAILCAVCNEINGQWVLLPLGWVLPCDWDNTLDAQPVEPLVPSNRTARIAGHAMVLLPGVVSDGISKFGDSSFQMCVHDTMADVSSLLEFMEAMSCSNVGSEVAQEGNTSKNARRIRDGKLPIYETRVLTVEIPRETAKRQTSIGDALRLSPRQHLRRGHIRRLTDERKIWVQSCVVGSANNGVINKSYRVRAA
jgi:hypothetical protein